MAGKGAGDTNGARKSEVILLGGFAGFAGSQLFVAFDRDTLPKQVSLFAG